MESRRNGLHNCALTIRKYLEKQGMQEVKVNSVTGDVSFQMNGGGKAKSWQRD